MTPLLLPFWGYTATFMIRGEDVVDGVKDAGDAVADGVDDAIDAVDPDADTNNGGKTNTGR